MNSAPDLYDESPTARVRRGPGDCTTAELLSVLLRRRDAAQREGSLTKDLLMWQKGRVVAYRTVH